MGGKDRSYGESWGEWRWAFTRERGWEEGFFPNDQKPGNTPQEIGRRIEAERRGVSEMMLRLSGEWDREQILPDGGPSAAPDPAVGPGDRFLSWFGEGE